MKIGILDCETLSLNTNAVVYECTLLTSQVDQWYQPIGDTKEQRRPVQWTRRIDILEQMRLGRHVSVATLDWQFQHFARFPEMVYGQDVDPVYPILSPVEFVTELHTECHGLEELWINKASFDYSVLHSLAQDIGFERQNIWAHDIERDLRTVRKVFGIRGTNAGPGSHRSAADCDWASQILTSFGWNMKQGVLGQNRKEGNKEST